MSMFICVDCDEARLDHARARAGFKTCKACDERRKGDARSGHPVKRESAKRNPVWFQRAGRSYRGRQ